MVFHLVAGKDTWDGKKGWTDVVSGEKLRPAPGGGKDGHDHILDQKYRCKILKTNKKGPLE